MADSFTPAQRSRIMAAIKAKDTKPEMIVRRMVHAMGCRYRLHDRKLPGTPDMVFPRLRKAINVSGCFWHMHHCGECRIPATNREYWLAKLTRNAQRDRHVRRALRKAGWQLLVVWECQAKKSSLAALERRVTKFLATTGNNPSHAGRQSPHRQQRPRPRTGSVFEDDAAL